MEAILPLKIKNEQKFFDSALKLGYDEMEICKFIYVMQLSDVDVFPKMHDERINMLIYGWELCDAYKQKLSPNEFELPEEMEMMLKLLVPWSMDIWFSKEWGRCKFVLKSALIICLKRAHDLFMRMPDMMQINWDFLLLYNLKPWDVVYLKNLTVRKEKTLENGALSIETEERPATDDDIAYLKLEQLPIIVLRLVKLFDQSSIDMVKTLCMRVIAAWNKIHQTELETSSSRRSYIPPEDKRCLMLICHIYLMAVYESDDVKGYVIDNMINNIRFYYQGFQNFTPIHAMDNLEYTPARYIALTNVHLRVQKRDFFDFFIWNKYDTSLVNLFGIVSQAYKSYLLGNLLMELNNMNEDDFASNIPLYKRLINSYVNEREKSEMFLINELNKIEAQRYAHNIKQTVTTVTDFKSKICKGNRMSNIGNYENSDDTVAPLTGPKNENNSTDMVYEVQKDIIGEEMEDEKERVLINENELRLDPIFQNLPNNESILYYVYDVLAKKDYTGWNFAKVVLLVKIIDCEQNMIETWRYHPGLTTDFMLNLEVKLSEHYVALAKIFKDHFFLEQEFWLTAFYLNPTSDIYEIIKRLGMRNNRKRADDYTKNIDNIETKYGLLSSTIDVKDLASMSNTDDPATDYDPLFSALHSLRVPDSLVKDMLTAIFLPRNRSFAWSIDWVILRNRCKMIMRSSAEKKRFVDLNMAEANERLKFLIIDYEKYKNRPQLDYGSIEEGYENVLAGGEYDKDSEEEEEEEEEEDFEDDEDVYESKRRGRGSSAAAAKKDEEKVEEDNSQEDDPFLMGKRRTRARTAATLASFLFQTLPRSTRRKKNQILSEDETKTDEEKTTADNDEKSFNSKSFILSSEFPINTALGANCKQKGTQTPDIPCKNLKECLKERPAYLNTTQGFQNLVDIWNVEKSELQSIDDNCISLMESSNALQIAVKLKLLNKEINPLGCDEKEFIDDTEMIIHNAEFSIKKEDDLNTFNLNKMCTEKSNEIETTIKNVETNAIRAINIEPGGEIDERPYLQTKEKSPREIVMEYELPLAEENSRETSNSDISTAAHKDSEEVSESNTEANSKRNSINFDTETEHDNEQIKEKCKQINLDSGKSQAVLEEKDNKAEESRCNEKSFNLTAIKIAEESKKAHEMKMLRTQETFDQPPVVLQGTTESFLEKLSDTEQDSNNPEENIPGKCEKSDYNLANYKKQKCLDDNMHVFGRPVTDQISEAQTVEYLTETTKKSYNLGNIVQEADDDEAHTTDTETNSKSNKSESKLSAVDAMKTYNSACRPSSIKTHISEINLKADDLESYDAKPSNNNRSSSRLHNNAANIRCQTGGEFYETGFAIAEVFTSDTSEDSIKDSEVNQENSDAETKKLTNLCLTTNVNVLLHKLSPGDLVNLRQPIVKLHRISYEKYTAEFRAKRKCIDRKVYMEFDYSSDSIKSFGSNTSSSETYQPKRVKRKIPIRRQSARQPHISESENDSNNSDDFKLSTIIAKARKRRLSTPSTSQSSTSQQVSGSKSVRKSGPKSRRYAAGPKSSKQNLVVTPRSASGLKLRISSAEQNRQEAGAAIKRSRPVVYDEIIQLSSSSSDTCPLNDLAVIEEELIEVDHPLFEEEIII